MQKNCKNCSAEFTITEKDHDFYKRMAVPEPTLCPDCRWQRRIAHRNERSLYKRKCDLCHKPVISVFHKDSDCKVYCYDCWWGDKWDPMDFGRDFDFSRPFFEQFSELQKDVPHFALFQDGTSENCEYVNFGVSNKNCYLSLCAYSEDVYYTDGGVKSNNIMDCQKCMSCELCYDCIDCTGGYNLLFSQDCFNCSDSYFLKDCVSCNNCFCSVGLRNAKYVFCNEQFSEEEYKKRISEIKFTHETIEKWKKELENISITVPKKYIHGTGNQNVTGDYLDNCKNVKNCYDCLVLEDSAYCIYTGFAGTRDMYDCTNAGPNSELCYELGASTEAHNCKFLYFFRGASDSEYCQFCFSSSNLFGCIGLKHKKYCIFNKQYSKGEYEGLVLKIIEHMKKTGEYGEYFPVSNSTFGYNETLAQDYFPLTKEQALQKGYKWKDPDKDEDQQQTEGALTCINCSKKYRIIKQESEFYKKFNLPIPEKCPECRLQIRFKKRNPRKLYDRTCDKCHQKIKTTYSPNRPEKVYCESCYLKGIV